MVLLTYFNLLCMALVLLFSFCVLIFAFFVFDFALVAACCSVVEQTNIQLSRPLNKKQ